MQKSPFLRLNWQDLLKSVAIIFIGVVASSVVAAVDAGSLPTVDQLKEGAILGLKAAGLYLLKNLFTNSEDKLLAKG